MKIDILIAGVGGQGTILASRLLADAAIDAGFFARTGETIGMSQRGGCVVSNVRLGQREANPYIPMGQADLLLGFELAETARNMGKLKQGGAAVVNTQQIKPVSLSLGIGSYDVDTLTAYIHDHAGRVLMLDAYALAVRAGSAKAVNIVMAGAACGAHLLPFSKEALLQAVIRNVPQRYAALNRAAFEYGYAEGQVRRNLNA